MPEEKEEGQQPAAVNPPDVHADLDDEAQVDDDNNGPGVMKELLRAVHARLKEETHRDFAGEKWLLGIFESNDWWLRVERLEVDKVFERLQIQPSLMEYYRDINLWLPDLRWGAMPPCPLLLSYHTRPYFQRQLRWLPQLQRLLLSGGLTSVPLPPRRPFKRHRNEGMARG